MISILSISSFSVGVQMLSDYPCRMKNDANEALVFSHLNDHHGLVVE